MRKNNNVEINIKSFLEKRFDLCQDRIYLCSPATFLNILLLEKKRLIRNNSELFLLNFYFTSENENIMYKFKNKIQNILNKNLRNSDVITWASFNHLIILFRNGEIEKVKSIRDRIDSKIKESDINNYLIYTTKIKVITKQHNGEYN